MRLELVVVGVLVMSSSAEAKYDPCGSLTAVFDPPARVPRNAKLWLWDGSSMERLRIRGHGIDRPFGPPHAGSGSRLSYFDPGLLEPGGTYAIEVVGEWGRYKLGELALTSEEDHEPPRAPQLRALTITQLIAPGQPVSTFGPGPASDIVMDLDLPDDAFALDISYDDSTVHGLVPREDIGRLGRNLCGPERSFRVGARTCVSIRAIDIAGNVSPPATRCATVAAGVGDTSRTAHTHTWPRRQRPPRHAPYGWLAVAALAAWLVHRGSRVGHAVV